MVIDSVKGEEVECVWLKAYKQISSSFLLDSLESVPSIDLSLLFRPNYEEN